MCACEISRHVWESGFYCQCNTYCSWKPRLPIRQTITKGLNIPILKLDFAVIGKMSSTRNFTSEFVLPAVGQ